MEVEDSAEDSVAGEAEEVVVEGEAARSRATQHPEVAAEVEMEPTRAGPGLGVGTGWGQVEVDVEEQVEVEGEEEEPAV